MIDMEEGAIFRDEIEIFVLLFSCFEMRSRLDIVILMFRDENEKHRLNFSRSSEKNLSQFSRDLARTRILADLCFMDINFHKNWIFGVVLGCLHRDILIL